MEFEKIGFLHIGLPKTATSFLQKEVFPNLKMNYISQEHLSGATVLERYTMLRGLRYYYGDVKLLVGVRNVESLKRSLYSEYIKMGNFHSYSYWEKYLIEPGMFDISGYIVEIKKFFSNVYIYKFEDIVKDEEKTVNDILRFIGTSYRYKSRKVNKRYNTKFNGIEIVFFRFINFLLEGYKFAFGHHARTYKGWVLDRLRGMIKLK